MNHPNRRADDHRPKLPLRWGERFTLLLTGQNSGVVGQYGATWPGQPVEYERVNVIVEGSVPKLDDIEQYRMQMAAIGTASFGYWKEGDTIHPDYDTVPLRDVARLYAKYEALFKEQPNAAARDVLAERRRQVEQEGYDHEHDDAHPGGEIAAYAAFYAMPQAARDWPAPETGYGATFGEAIVPADWKVPKEGDRRAELVKAGALILAEIERIDRAAKQAALQELADQAQEMGAYDSAPQGEKHRVTPSHIETRVEGNTVHFEIGGIGLPSGGLIMQLPGATDAVDAALADAIAHGTGAFRVHGDGSTEHVDLQAQNRAAAEIVAFSPPASVRDALHPGYAKFGPLSVQAVEGLPAGTAVLVAGDKPENRAVITGIGQPADDGEKSE